MLKLITVFAALLDYGALGANTDRWPAILATLWKELVWIRLRT